MQERYLDEMTKQVGDVLTRATNQERDDYSLRSTKCRSNMQEFSLHWQAQKLCGMVSAQLDEKATVASTDRAVAPKTSSQKTH